MPYCFTGAIKLVPVDARPPRFKLRAFITHLGCISFVSFHLRCITFICFCFHSLLGLSLKSGHYVAHILQDDGEAIREAFRFVLFFSRSLGVL